MHEIAELEGRITAAMARIARGVDALIEADAARMPVAAPLDTGSADRMALQDALEEERMANAQLNERLRVVKDRDTQALATAAAELARLTGLADAQGLEVQRLHKLVVRLREETRALREALDAGAGDPGATGPSLVNRAMLAELDALRAERGAEAQEVAEILAALDPLLRAEEEKADA